MEIKANEIKIVEIDSLILNPKNNNKHPKEQIERLAKIIKYQGFRNPITVSNRTGFVVAGHGRIEAAILAGLKEVPAIYQDFESDAQEYAYLTSDNAIALWAEIDKNMVLEEMTSIPDFDLDLLGVKKFDIIKEIEESDSSPMQDEEKFLIIIECKDEMEQCDLYEEFQTREMNCKLMN